MTWLVSLALAADEPCEGHTFDQRVDSEHFWVEWEGDTLSVEQATAIADYAEDAREVFLELGWPLTDEPIVYAVRPTDTTTGIGGLAQTVSCDDVLVPHIELYLGEYSEGSARNVAAHELGH
ncbi:MAG: hypothetical protein GY884_16460, partial [Proteobacteria bacterium]|nr:hypothetical protein [Pseudomonadota bacterium]